MCQGSHMMPVLDMSIHNCFVSFVFPSELSSMAMPLGPQSRVFQSHLLGSQRTQNLRANSGRLLAAACRLSSPGPPGTADRWKTGPDPGAWPPALRDN